jgi:N-methylhydantoinase B
MTVSGTHPRTRSYFVGVFPYPGGYGASRASDGLVHATSPQSMANFMSLELSEHRFPIRFDYFALREDSGGAGLHRGGCGSRYSLTMTSECIVSVLGDRVDHPPFGIAGGGPAQPNEVIFHTDGKDWKPAFRSKQEKEIVRCGESVRVASPGGGGFGNPLQRDVVAVERDLNLGYVSPATAEREYGVVIASRSGPDGHIVYRVDAEATRQRRAAAPGEQR